MQRYKRRGDLLGHMRQKVTFVRKTGSKNSAISTTGTDTVVRTCRAAVDKPKMSEGEVAGRDTSLVTNVFTVRYNDLLDDTTLVLQWRDEDYNITGVNDLFGDMAFMEITAQRSI